MHVAGKGLRRLQSEMALKHPSHESVLAAAEAAIREGY